MRDLNVGVTTNRVYTVHGNAMCNAAREVILMADSSKFGRKANVVCSLETVDKTDHGREDRSGISSGAGSKG